MSWIIDKLFSSVALSHFIVDILNGQRAVLLAYWSRPMGISNTLIGVVSTVYIVSAALAQPIFGHFADKYGPRWIVSGGVLWMGFWFSMAIFTPTSTALVYLVLASLGSGAFHPARAAQATTMGREQLVGRETTTTSIFFLFGQGGSFFGPLIGGPLLDRFGVMGLLPLVFLTMPVAGWAGWHLQKAHPFRMEGIIAQRTTFQFSTSLLTFVLIAVFLSWVQQNMVTFIPKYLADLGQSPSIYGFLSALFMGGYAIGNVIGGILSDKYGKAIVIRLAFLLGAIPLAVIPILGYHPLYYLLIPLSGFLTGSAYCVIIVLSQQYIQGGTGLVTGLVLGFMFSSGSLGALASGAIADHYGFIPVFYMTALICLMAGVISLRITTR